jgi:hypothetical protein
MVGGMPTLTFTFQVTGTGSYEKDTDLSSAVESYSIGSNDLDAISHEFTNGTGNNQANTIWSDERTLANGGTDSLDLAGGLTDVFGSTLTFTKIKAILIDIDAPDGTKALRVGPRSVANAFTGPWGDASDFITVTRTYYQVEPYSGWTVTAGTGDLLVVNNNSGVSVTYRIVLLGLA